MTFSSRFFAHNNNNSFPHRNDDDDDDDDSAIEASASAIESSNRFVAGDYEHNLEILDNLDAESTLDEFEEDRLIYAATKKFANADQSPRHLVVSSVHLNGESTANNILHLPENGDSESLRMSSSGNNMIRDFLMIFKGDDSYMEISREEIRRVRAMHKRFMEGAQFGFNYNVLLFIASLIAALGLGGNSTATIIASMLVSPLMGPVMGMAYGATILDLNLFYVAFVTELVSLLACIFMGAVVGGCMIPFYDLPEDWPTEEMISRTEMQNFYIGIPIAFASGLGVAVSVLDEQTSSLVGVAISASLLPPAINAGMLWTTYFFFDEDANEKHNFWIMGAVSLGLTLINILMIIVSSMFMFRVKERMTIKKKKIFWTDLGLARKVYRNLAIHDREHEGPMRRMGAKFSSLRFPKMFSSTNLMNSTRNNTSNHASSQNNDTSNHASSRNNRTTPRTYVEVVRGLEDAHPEANINRQRSLSTVIEEGRISGYSSS